MRLQPPLYAGNSQNSNRDFAPRDRLDFRRHELRRDRRATPQDVWHSRPLTACRKRKQCLVSDREAGKIAAVEHGNFDSLFKGLTGNPPLSWQRRLHDQWIAGDIKPVIDLPTGMGKTMVMAIWLIARASNRSLPRRLVYIVDRRTVVDQATDLAEKIKARAEAMPGFEVSISTLRGQFADNRDWTRDLSKPAIIIGTVDMIGSRLLFSGYRSSYKARPLDAGLLGQDALLILDEAHLSGKLKR
jgi:CRISPR-associated helicase Cas3